MVPEQAGNICKEVVLGVVQGSLPKSKGIGVGIKGPELLLEPCILAVYQ